MTSLPQETAPAPWQEATFGSGCFWCTEAVFQELRGVLSVVSGYTGGQTKNPTYRDICTGTTGHAEVIRVRFDPTVTHFAELLEVFWKTHDPTTLKYLIERVGVDNVVMGTDLPFDMATPQPMDMLEEVADAATVRTITEENPRRLYKFGE